MLRSLLTGLALATAIAPAHAVILTQWTFNSPTPDANTGTGTTLPFIGTGTASVIGGVTSSFASGDASGGSGDPAVGDDSGFQTTTYAAQAAGDKTRGVRFDVSTVGFQDIVLSYDLRHSNTSSRYEQLQYTLDGSTFVDAALFDGNAGDTWFNGRSFDLSAISGADDNPNFGFRVVATFAPGSAGYAASNPANSYASAGTWRFDMVTVSAVPVPEPGTYALMLAGLIGVVITARRFR